MGRSLDGVQKRPQSTSSRFSSFNTSQGEIEDLDWTSPSSRSQSTDHGASLPDPRMLADFNKLPTDANMPWDEPGILRQHHFDFMNDNGGTEDPDFGSLVMDLDEIEFGSTHDASLETGSSLENRAPHSTRSSSQRLSRQPNQRPTSRMDIYSSSSGRSSHVTRSVFPVGHSVLDIVSWATMLEELSLSRKTSVALDDLLSKCSTLLPQVSHALRSLPPDPSCMTPVVLILLCLTQAVALFEDCIPSVIRGISVDGSDAIAVHIGGYEVDRDAQQVLQRHIINKEVCKILHASKLVKQALHQPWLASVSQRAHGLLVEDLQVRVRNLLQMVKE